MKNRIHILDTTLRDGSYAVKESFTPIDTATICKALDEAGVEFIEIGNGAGLNAQKLGWAHIVGTDEEHMKAAKGVVKKAKYGFFCVPGIARLKDIDIAHQYGTGFIRIGIYPENSAQAKEFIELAKKYGMFVSVNMMKSYSLPPQEFAGRAKTIEGYGADAVYIVDSAGGMFPEDVIAYYRAIRDISGIQVGFHGHNNLGLAIANSIAIADAGASFIDVSLQGLGRSSGNTMAEIMLLALKKKGYETNIDILKVMEAGNSLIRPLLERNGEDPLNIVAGYADYAFFESSYTPQIIKIAEKHNISPALLMVNICKINKLRPLGEDKIDEIAVKIKKDKIVI